MGGFRVAVLGIEFAFEIFFFGGKRQGQMGFVIWGLQGVTVHITALFIVKQVERLVVMDTCWRGMTKNED